MEFDTIEREIRIDAAPEIVFDVVSNPEHVRQWWSDQARYEVRPGSMGELVFSSPDGTEMREGFQVVDAEPYSLFSFRWTQRTGETAEPDNSLLVSFALEAVAGGTLLTMTETGFRERGWEADVLEQTYNDHVDGWDHFLGRLQPYAAGLVGDRA